VHTFLLQRRSGKPERILVWDTQDVSVGRAPENDVVMGDPEASRNHAQFYRCEAGYSVRNMSISNPTYVNGEPVDSRPLENKDVVRIADTEFVFYRVPRNPVTMGIKVEYASQLKGFAPKVAAGEAEATILGLEDTVEVVGDDEEFEVRPPGDFDHDLQGVPQPPRPRNLDLELAGDGLEDLDVSPEPAAKATAGAEAWTLEEEQPPGTMSLHLEIQGLSGPQRASIEALLGKVIQIPRLRIRIKPDDLA
jgi:predicted component of type VI protein secretion system